MSAVSRLLLDTHAFLWFVFDDPKLPPETAERLEDPGVEKLLSTVSLWEIAIKSQIGKLGLGMTLESFLDRHVLGVELTLVDLELPHLVAYSNLPLHHRDPFDRMLIAQAQTLAVPIVTGDSALSGYAVQTLWIA